MTTATLRVSLNGGAVQTGGVVATLGQSCQLSRASTDGVSRCRFEIYACPPTFACPSGWTTEGEVYYFESTTTSPPAFTLTPWGKWLFRLRYNNAADTNTTGLIDTSTAVQVYSAIGLHDVAEDEEEQFDSVPKELQIDLRIIQGAITSSVSGVSSVTGDGAIDVSAPTGDVTLSVKVDDDTIVVNGVSDELEIGECPLDRIERAGSSEGDILTIDSGGDPVWGTPSAYTPDAIIHPVCKVAAFHAITVASPGSRFQDKGLSNPADVGTRVFLAGQSSLQEGGPWVWNGPSVPMTRPADWTGAVAISGAHLFPVRFGRELTEQNPHGSYGASNALMFMLTDPLSGTLTVGTTSAQFAQTSPSASMHQVWHQPVDVSTTTAVDIEDMGAAVVDGVQLINGSRLILLGQGNARENGPWELDAGTPNTLTRPTDWERDSLLASGETHYFPVLSGNSRGDWKVLVGKGVGYIWGAGSALTPGVFTWTTMGGPATADAAGMHAVLAERGLMNCDLGLPSSEVYTGSAASPQGMDYLMGIDGSEYIFLSQRCAGSTWETTERLRLVQFAYASDLGDHSPLAYSTELQIGHGQDLSALVDSAGQIWLFCTQTTVTGHTGADAGRGYSKIEWKAGSTSQVDVTNYQLIGYSGSGHDLERFYNCTACVSTDGQYVVLFANDTRSVSKYCLVWDRAEVEAAADPLTVAPLKIWKATATFDSLESNILQGVACDGALIYTLHGYTNSLGWHFINVHDMDGNVLRRLRVTGPRSLYGLDLLLDHPTKGTPSQFEPEGLAVKGSSLLWCTAERWRTGADIVSFEGTNCACINGNTGEPPHQTRYWIRTNKSSPGPWYDSTTYSNGTTNTVGKWIWELKEKTGASGELPLDAGRYSHDSGATLELGNGYPDISVPLGQNLQFQLKNYQTGETRNWLEYDENTQRIFDGTDGADSNSYYAAITAVYSGGREYAAVRGRIDAAGGSGMNFYGAGDSVCPHAIRVFTSATGNHSVQFTDRGFLVFDSRSGADRTGWFALDFVTDTTTPGAERYYTQLRGDRSAGYGAGINLYSSRDTINPNKIIFYVANDDAWTMEGADLLPTGAGTQDIGNSSYPVTELHVRKPVRKRSSNTAPSASNSLYVTGGYHHVVANSSYSIRRIYDADGEQDGQELLLIFDESVNMQTDYTSDHGIHITNHSPGVIAFVAGDCVRLVYNSTSTMWVAPYI